jgi:hypothetical protein
VTDWTFALLFRPDVTKVSLNSEAALLLREVRADIAGRQRGPTDGNLGRLGTSMSPSE